MAAETQENGEIVSRSALWFGLLAGPIAWSLRLLISYPLVPVACRLEATYLLHLVSAAFLLITLAGGFVAWRSDRDVRSREHAEERDVDEWTVERTRFMTLLGLLSSGYFALVIVVEWSTVFFTDPCIIP